MPRRCWTALRGGIDSVHLTSHGSRLEAGERERKSIHPQPLQGFVGETAQETPQGVKFQGAQTWPDFGRLGLNRLAPSPLPDLPTARSLVQCWSLKCSAVGFVFGWAWRRAGGRRFQSRSRGGVSKRAPSAEPRNAPACSNVGRNCRFEVATIPSRVTFTRAVFRPLG